MKKIDYKKIFEHIVHTWHHDLSKIEQVVHDAKEREDIDLALDFSTIINDRQWSAAEKEKLLRFFGLHLKEHFLSYRTAHGTINEESAITYTINNGNTTGFTALIRTARECDYGEDLHSIYLKVAYSIVKGKSLDYFKILNYFKIFLDSLNEEEIKELLKPNFVNRGPRDKDFSNLIALVITLGNIELVKKYLPLVENIDIYLPIAIKEEKMEIVDLLLSLKADVNYPGEPLLGIVSPLKTAIILGNLDLVKLLIERGASLDRVETPNRNLKEQLYASCNPIDRNNLRKYEEKNEESIDFIIYSSPLEFAYTLDREIIYRESSSSSYLEFKGSTPKIAHKVRFRYDNQDIKRVAIVDYLFEKQEDKSVVDFTRLLAITSITYEVATFQKYVDYCIQHRPIIDFDYLFDVIVDIKSNIQNRDLITQLIKLIKEYDSSLLLDLFTKYQNKYKINCSVLDYEG